MFPSPNTFSSKNNKEEQDPVFPGQARVEVMQLGADPNISSIRVAKLVQP